MRKLIAILSLVGISSVYGGGYVGGDVNQDLTGILLGTNNLSDVADPNTSRANLNALKIDGSDVAAGGGFLTAIGAAYNSSTALSANTTLDSTYRGKIVNVTTGSSANVTIKMPAVAGLWDGWMTVVRKADSGTKFVIIQDNASTGIVALGTINHSSIIWTDGTNWFHRDMSGGYDTTTAAFSLTAQGGITLTAGANGNVNLVTSGTGHAQLNGTSFATVATSGLFSDMSIASEAQGDILYRNASGWVRLGAGTSGQLLTSGGAAANPSWTTVSGGSGGGVISYSAPSLTLTANTYYAPPGGGGTPSTTEANVDVPAPSAATITNFQVETSAAPGASNSFAFTWRKAGSDQSVTCTISGGSATSCSDTTHSFTVAQGDVVSVKIVSTGTIVVTPNVMWLAQWGTTGSNGTVNSGTSGNFAKYASTGTAVSDGPAVPAGTVVGTSDTQTLTNKTLAAASNTVGGTYIGRQYLTSGTTYTPTSGTATAILRMVGGGGGGAGEVAASSQADGGGGGGAGGYLEVKVTSVSGTYTYGIGAGGAGGANTGAAGSNGGDTTFVNGGTTYTAAKGSGGAQMTSGTSSTGAAGGAGGTATNGDLNVTGQSGTSGGRTSATNTTGGAGASTMWGQGGPTIPVGATATALAGNAGSGYGSGGGGATSVTATGAAGGNGAQGVIIVDEYR